MVIEIEDQFKATLSNLATYQNYPEGFAMVPLTSFHGFFLPLTLFHGAARLPPKLIYKTLGFFFFLSLSFILWFLFPKHLLGIGISWEHC